MTRIITAYLKRDVSWILNGFLIPIFGAVHQLLTFKHYDQAFLLLETIIEHIEIQYMETQLAEILKLLFSKLRPDYRYFTKRFLVFLCFMIWNRGPDVIIEKLNSVEPGCFMHLLKNYWLVHAYKFSDTIERNMSSIAMTRLLTESVIMFKEEYFTFWLPILQCNLKALEDSYIVDTEPDTDEENESAYNIYSQLVHSTPLDERKALEDFDCVNLLVVKLNSLNPVQLSSVQNVLKGLSPTQLKCLQELFMQQSITPVIGILL
eukprot:TRINITY_DN14223_c0_g1_i1.p1 TRINITY_DN14223_c0_g1~~TRINITY_DN14223_c0_g1_i1.p1  ORF type:complete len:270 (-),score=21.65 TRINITY_DN14223_c0_g1_i1:180-968(-)